MVEKPRGFTGRGVRVEHHDKVCVVGSCRLDIADYVKAPLCERHARIVWAAITLRENVKVISLDKYARNRQGYVYIIQFGNRIKIGFSSDLARRLGSLPYDEILAIVPGTLDTEREFHKRFASLRCGTTTGREWFEADESIIQFAETLGRQDLLGDSTQAT